MKQPKIFIYGRHAVEEALINVPTAVRKVYVSSKMDDTNLRRLIDRTGVQTEPLDPRRVTSYVEGNAPHQGIVASIAPHEIERSFSSFLDTFTPTSDTLLVLLHEVQDPHNVGALIRSAVAFGASAILMPSKKQASVTPATVKASAGMLFRLPLVSVDSIPDALAALKEKGVRVYGLAGDSEHSIVDEPFRAPSVLVLGNEGAGIPQAVRKLCDLTLAIPMHSRAESLNVAASGAVALYAWSLRHKKALSSR